MDRIKSVWNKIKTFAFSRRKRFYIILIVISSLVLLMDLSVRLLVPSASMFGAFTQSTSVFSDDSLSTDADASGDALTQDGMQDFSGGSFASGDASFSFDGSTEGGMSLPGGDSSDQGSFEQQSAEVTSDDEMQASQMPDMSTDGASQNLPDGFASGDASFSFDDSGEGSMSLPDGTDASADSSSEDGTDGSTLGMSVSIGWPLRILMGIRAAFWPIFLIAALIDGLSIFMLVQLRRREKKAAEAAEQARIAEALAADDEVHLVRPKQKKKISPTIWVLVIAAIVLLVVIVRILANATGAEASQTEATVYSAEVESGDISTVLPGTGTLTEEDAAETSLPSEVEITKWYVSDGDIVEEGDILASVDTDSALSAIASVQEVITSLDEALEALEDSDTTADVTAAAGGRVKAVYAQTDTTVIDTIYESGALLLLSLDGLMAVSFETDADLSVGDTVTVTLSDGTEEEGSVESALEGVVVVTITDEGPEVGDTVTVTDSDGTQLGSGELYIHSELKVYAFSGTVSSVSVSEEDEVDAGDTLLSLTDVDNTFETELLLEQRSVLEEQMQTLFRLYQDGYLYADTAGAVSGISTVDSDEEDASSDASAEETSLIQSAGGIILTTSASDETVESEESGETEDSEETETESSYISYLAVVTQIDGTTATATLYVLSSTDLSDLTGTSARLDLASAAVWLSEDGELTEGTYEDLSVGDTLILICGADVDTTESISPACVIAVMGTSDASDEDTDAQDDGQSGDSQGNSQDTGDAYSQSDDLTAGLSGEDDTSASAGTDTSSLYASLTTTDTTAAETVTETLTEEVTTSYSVAETTVASITPQDYMYVTITVDELDILSLEEGLEAQVSLDAFPGQAFTGVVESIDLSGTNEGGNSKYTAVVRIDRSENMLAGMNASVKIVLGTTEDVLYVPADAIVEDETGTYVYTNYDEKTETFGDPVEVETGVSDGTNVEIVSGLSLGDTYYYSVLDVVNYSTSSAQSSSGSIF